MQYFNSRKIIQNHCDFNSLHKTLICDEPLRIRFDKADGFVDVYDKRACKKF